MGAPIFRLGSSSLPKKISRLWHHRFHIRYHQAKSHASVEYARVSSETYLINVYFSIYLSYEQLVTLRKIAINILYNFYIMI